MQAQECLDRIAIQLPNIAIPISSLFFQLEGRSKPESNLNRDDLETSYFTPYGRLTGRCFVAKRIMFNILLRFRSVQIMLAVCLMS